MDEFDEPDDRGPWDLEPLAANGRSFGLHDLGLVVYDEPQRPAHGHHGEGFERRVEREAAQPGLQKKMGRPALDERHDPVCYTGG